MTSPPPSLGLQDFERLATVRIEIARAKAVREGLSRARFEVMSARAPRVRRWDL